MLDRYLRVGLVVTVVASLGILAYATVATSRAQPPIPRTVVSPAGTVLYTAADIRAGKQIFQRTDLMDFGTLYGNGAYFGPDWGTDYLHRETVLLRDMHAQATFGRPYAGLSAAQRSRVDGAVTREQKTNRYAKGTLQLTDAQARAERVLAAHYRQLFLRGDSTLGLASDTVKNAREAAQLTAFIGWVAWTETAQRPGERYSYTNNWPYEPAAGNRPTHGMWVWTWASIAAMAAVALLAIGFYRRRIAPPAGALAVPEQIGDAPLTRSQASTWKWLLLVPPLLLLQAGVGSLIAHLYVERDGFFGLDIQKVLPFNILHAWHVQLPIAWIAASWLAAGLFLAPIVGRREPRRQRLLANALWAAVVLVVVGSLVGIWLGAKGYLDGSWFWLGNQGLEYIELGRAFQIGLLAGLLLWAAILARAFLPGLRRRGGWGSVEHLLLYSGLAIGIVYATGMLSRPLTGATMTDYWRWWVIHLWVENAFEFFTVAVTAYAVLSMGLLDRKFVERVVYFELILTVGSGTVGMGHHFYFVGEPALWLGLGGMFSMLEVIPLGFLGLRAWHEYRTVRAAGRRFPQRLAFMFFMAAAAWNVLGAGVIGAIVNPPIVNYYEHGTFMTLAHAHAAMFGSFGLLALGLVYMTLRGLVEPDFWSDRLGRLALWAFNGALVLWLALNLIPVGIGQFLATVDHGYAFARSTGFYDGWTWALWLRFPGDVVFAVAGALVLVDLVRQLRHRRRPTVGDGQPMDVPPPVEAAVREPVAV
jgi:nitric oxide reductase subunit B